MDNRKLGWIAIGLGVVALLVALGGRARPMGWYNQGPQFGYGPSATAPRGVGPRDWAGPQGPAQQNPGPQQAGPQGPDPQPWAGPRGRFGDQQGFGGPRGFGGPHGFGHFWFFPFMVIGGLFRLALFALVIMLLARWFFRRRDNQAPPPPPPAAGSSSPGPEQPPYTGGTQAL